MGLVCKLVIVVDSVTKDIWLEVLVDSFIDVVVKSLLSENGALPIGLDMVVDSVAEAVVKLLIPEDEGLQVVVVVDSVGAAMVKLLIPEDEGLPVVVVVDSIVAAVLVVISEGGGSPISNSDTYICMYNIGI